jgi:hypothetical protein
MQGSYTFYIGLLAVPISWRDLEVEQMTSNLQELGTKLHFTYKQLRAERKTFPCFGRREDLTFSRYSRDSDQHVVDELFCLTGSFPNFTFKIYHLYMDDSMMHIYHIRGKELLCSTDFNFGNIDLEGGFDLSVSVKEVDVSHDFTEIMRTGNVKNIEFGDFKYNGVEPEASQPMETNEAEMVLPFPEIGLYDVPDVIRDITGSPDAKIFRLLFANRGVVYGGYLRDLIAGVTPNDIDVVLSSADCNYFENFNIQLLELGYTASFNTEHETTVYKKTGHLPIEAYAVEDSPTDTLITPISDPDFSVNLLAFDGSRLYHWVEPDRDVHLIIKGIQERKAIQWYEASPERVEKMRGKGYSIELC